jgi:hypothetical protein
MKNIFEKILDNFWFKLIGFILLSVIPAYDFYKNLFNILLYRITNSSITFTNSFFDILSGLLLGSIFLLFLQSKKEYYRVKLENKRIREMFLAIHIFNNIRFHKIIQTVPHLFENEEKELKQQLFDVYKRDLHTDYSDKEIDNILDCFYRDHPKF